MVLTTAMLKEQLHNYQDVTGKISRMCKEGEIFALTRGVYETDRNVPGYCLAPAVYGPHIYPLIMLFTHMDLYRKLFTHLQVQPVVKKIMKRLFQTNYRTDAEMIFQYK